MKYSFIFPVHNEEEVLFSQIEKFVDGLTPNFKSSLEVLLIENGSTDKSWNLVKKLEKKFLFVKGFNLPSPSYGSAIKCGLINSRGQKIFLLNVDYFDFEFIYKAAFLLDTIDLVIGSKTLVQSDDQRSIYRRLTTYFFNSFLRLVLNYPGTDTHGIKAFRKSKKLINSAKICRTQNELFDTELVLRLTRSGAIFVDLPQQISEIRPSRYFGTRRIKSTINDFLCIIKSKYFFKKNIYFSLIDADDFGFSDQVNQAILKKVKSRTIDIVSIMPNLVKKKDLSLLKNKSFQVKYGMHFNLLRGQPVSKINKIPSLVNSQGLFYAFPFFMMRLLLGFIKLEEVKIEFYAQYQRLLDLGVKPTHLNSEQHLHIFSPLNQVLASEIKNTTLKKIRSVVSSFYSLDQRIFRKVALGFFNTICDLRFGKFNEFKKKYNAHIVHPGAFYE